MRNEIMAKSFDFAISSATAEDKIEYKKILKGKSIDKSDWWIITNIYLIIHV